MKISIRCQYALRALLDLARVPEDEIVPIHLIAARQHISKRFLEGILNHLRGGGFVSSKRGISGGYRLARPAEKTTLLELIVHVDGPPTIAVQSKSPDPSDAISTQQAILSVTSEIDQIVVKSLSQITLADLNDRSLKIREASAALEYSI